ESFWVPPRPSATRGHSSADARILSTGSPNARRRGEEAHRRTRFERRSTEAAAPSRRLTDDAPLTLPTLPDADPVPGRRSHRPPRQPPQDARPRRPRRRRPADPPVGVSGPGRRPVVLPAAAHLADRPEPQPAGPAARLVPDLRRRPRRRLGLPPRPSQARRPV